MLNVGVDMRERILDELKKIEEKENVKIIMAVESGSRAWGFASPIVYIEKEEFTWLKEVLPMYFSEKKSLYHYWHTADSTYREHLIGEEVKIKKYFYVLRPLLAAMWIRDKKTAPPMLFHDLVVAELEEEIRPELNRLLEMKKTLPEMGFEEKIPVIDGYIESVMPKIKAVADAMGDNVADWDALNKLFLRMVNVGR